MSNENARTYITHCQITHTDTVPTCRARVALVFTRLSIRSLTPATNGHGLVQPPGCTRRLNFIFKDWLAERRHHSGLMSSTRGRVPTVHTGGLYLKGIVWGSIKHGGYVGNRSASYTALFVSHYPSRGIAYVQHCCACLSTNPPESNPRSCDLSLDLPCRWWYQKNTKHNNNNNNNDNNNN